MKMNVVQPFDFGQIGDGCWTVNAARDANKMSDLEKLVEAHFSGKTPTIPEVREYLDVEVGNIMSKLGLDIHGKPIGTCSTKLFLRITGIVPIDAPTKDPEEARDMAKDLIYEDPNFWTVEMDRDDIEKIIPVAYDAGDGETHDYGLTKEEQLEIKDDLSGRELYCLIRMHKHDGGLPEIDRVEAFFDFDAAASSMKAEFSAVYNENEADMDSYREPTDEDCYVLTKDLFLVQWHIGKVLMKFGSN